MSLLNHSYMIKKEDYFDRVKGAKALTRSKIMDFKKCKSYFKKKHIEGTLEKKLLGDPLIKGSAVDCILTESREKFDATYYIVSGNRNKKALDYEFQLTETLYREILSLADSVERQDAYKEIKAKGYIAQELIQVDMELGEHFDCLCGLPDWYLISKDGKHCHIVDLKTSKDGDDRKYLWHCVDYFYFEQQALYQLILAKLHPEIETFISDHLVVEKDSNGIYDCYIYTLAKSRIEREKVNMLAYIEQIKNEKDFLPKNVSFKDAITIGALNNEE